MKKWANLMKRKVGGMNSDSMVKKVHEGGEITPEMKDALRLWSAMYENKAPWLSARVKSLNLPAAIAAEAARLTTVEMKTEISGSERAEYLSKMFTPALGRLRAFVEYGCAKGGMVMKPYVAGNEIRIEFIQADRFFPTCFDSSGNMTGVIFVGQLRKDGQIYTRLEEHALEGGLYIIRNKAYVSRSEGALGRELPLREVAEWSELAEEVRLENVPRLLLGYFKTPYANTLDGGSPVGVSVYARACELIEEADKQYSRLLWEFESGERALYVSDMAFRVDRSGKAVLPDKRLYRLLGIEQGGDDLFSEWSPSLREENILRGLNTILRKIEFNCGFAYGTLSDVDDVDKTAEEIRASKQRSYSMVCDLQKELSRALTELIYAMDTLCSLYKLAPEGRYSVSFEFDDSTVSDRAAEFAEKQQLVASGIMQPWEFRMWYFGETEEQAREAVGQSVFKVAESS